MSRADPPATLKPEHGAGHASTRRPPGVGDLLGPNTRQLGRYSLLRELRRSRESVTLLALDPVMHREVVLKVVRLPPPIDGVRGADAETHALEQAFVRQAQAAGRLQHPHIVTVFEAARVHDLAFLAVERVNGRPLHELLASGWRPEAVHCASLTARIADAIEYAHSQSIAHGHLGPQHVLLQPNGTPRIEGFGGWIDSGAAGEEALAHTEKLLPYFQNELTDEMRMRDVRAVMVLLHMMLTGKPPQQRASADGERPRTQSVLELRPDTPPQLAQLIDETTGATPSAAHRTAGDLRDALTAYLWNARKSHVAPATIGIPLAAPPEASPNIPAAELAMVARPRTAAPLIPALPPPSTTITRTITGNTRGNPQPAEADELSSAEVEAESNRHIAPASSTGRSLGQWLRSNRLAVALAAVLVVVGIAVGVLLGRTAPTQRTLPLDEVQASAPAATHGMVQLDIQPWGEILVDGKATGVSPPMTELKLTVGPHTIEIRYSDGKAVSAQVDVDASRTQMIRHRFD